MATALTPNALLRKPAPADRNWDVPLNANSDFLDGVAAIGRLLVTPAELPSTSLNVRVTAGNYEKADGTIGGFAGVGSQALAASSTVALWLTDAGQLVSAANFPATPHVRLARVVTGSSSIESVSDERVVARTTGGGATLQVDPAANTVSFFGAAPAGQAPAIPLLTDASNGIASNTIADSGSSYDEEKIHNNFAALTAKVNALIAALQRFGLVGN